MAQISNKELLAQIGKLATNAENMELVRVNDLAPGGQAAFCCGCVCVSACLFNSSVGMKDLKILVEKGEVELPETLNQVLVKELKKQ